MYIKITHIVCFISGHKWLPKRGIFAICTRCREMRVSTPGAATTLSQVIEGLKNG